MLNLRFGIILFSFLCAYSVNAALPTQITAENLQTKNKDVISLRNFEKKGTILVFLSAKCPCSNSHVPLLKEMAIKYKDFYFVAIHSNPDEPVEFAKDYFKKADLPFPVLQDEKTEIADTLKAYKTPHAFVISAAGEIVYKGGVTNSAHAPSADKNLLADALDDILQNKDVRVASGRALGCVIMRSGETK